MNKTELVQQIAERNMIPKNQAARLLDSVLETVESTLAKGESIVIPGFGSFNVRDVASRPGVVPGTGEKIIIPAHKRVQFKAGSHLKDAVN